MINKDDEIFASTLGIMQEAIMAKCKDENYTINKDNYEKYLFVLGNLLKMAKEQGGKLEDIDIQPKQQHAFVTVVFEMIDLYGENVKTFTDMVEKVDVFSVEPLTDGTIRVGVTINNVFVKI